MSAIPLGRFVRRGPRAAIVAVWLAVCAWVAAARGADGDRVFDLSRVAVLRFAVTPTNYERMMTFPPSSDGKPNPPYVPADVVIDGEFFRNVAVRVKGYASLHSAVDGRYSLKVDFNRFDPTNRADGLTSLNVHNVATEASRLAEYLSYGAWREFGVPAPRTGWAEVWMNERYWGTYTTVEQVNQAFIRRHFPYSQGDLYKPEPPSGTLLWRGATIADYPNVNAELQDDTDHCALLRFLDVINHRPISEWPGVVDTRGVVAYLAGNVALGNWDTYTENAHNYYLYEQAPGRFTMLPWDMNFSQTNCSVLFPPIRRSDGDYGTGRGQLLTERFLGDPTYRQAYLCLLKEFVEGPASKEALNHGIDQAVAVLSNRLDVTAVRNLRFIIGRRVDSLRTALATALTNPPSPRLRLTELMARNARTRADEAGDFGDWLELHNPGGTPVDLSGMYLTDDRREVRKWRFPTDSVLEPGAFLLLWADGRPGQGRFHLNFKLDRDGETIALHDTDAHANLVVDSVGFGWQPTDVAFGRIPGTRTLWLPQAIATPGEANEAGDADGDGMPDAWELVFGFDPASTLDAGRDPDGDGVVNLDEFRAETDPREGNSVFKLLPPIVGENGITLRWPTVAGRDYQVEVSEEAAAVRWSPLGLSQRLGTTTETRASGQATRLYRVRWVGD